MILTITANPAIDKVYFVDEFVMGEVHRPKKMTATAGGKGINVARVSAILGEKVAASGFVGGFNGEFIKGEIEKIGIKNEFTEIENETRICVNISDDKGKSGEILESGPVVSSKETADFIKHFTENIDKYNIITISGSMPKGLDIDFYPTLIKIAKLNNKKIIIDTSGDSLIECIKAKPYGVKPNKFELSAYLGYKINSIESVVDAVKALKNDGIKLPIVSLGKDGCVVCLSDGVYNFKTPDLKIVNTVGSGDSFIGGIATGLNRNLSEIDTIKLAMACGTANTQFHETGMVSKELVEKIFNDIKVIKLEEER